MTKARQEINVRGPRADSVNRSERGVGVLGCAVGKSRESKLSARDGPCNSFERPDFRGRQAEPRQACWARAQNSGRIEGIEGCGEPAPNRGSAGRRQLLRHNDGGKTGISARAPAQRRASGGRDQFGKSPVNGRQRGNRGVEVGFGVDMRQVHSWLFVLVDLRTAGDRAYLIGGANSVSSTRRHG